MLKKIFVITMSFFSLISCGNKNRVKQENKLQETYDMYLLVGTYTQKESRGVNVYKFNTETGDAVHISEAEVSNPSYLAVSKDEKYVYTVSENDAENSKVTAFGFDKEKGVLTFINSNKSGDGPCFITINSDGGSIITADYGGGTISVLATNKDGSIDSTYSGTYSFYGKSAHSQRQTKSYLHNVKFSPDQRFLFANDLGADMIYRFEVTKDNRKVTLQDTPSRFSVKAGSGPRHTEFHPNGRFAYTIAELSGEVIVFDYDAQNGLLKEKQVVKADTLNAEASGDIQIAPNGKYLYASNRLKGDGIAIFSVDDQSGELTKIGYQQTGIHPRNFVISPNGKLLLVANRDSNNIQVFKIESNGFLTNINKNIELSMPVCLKFASLK